MILDVNKKYSRKDGIVYDGHGNPVLKLKQRFPDFAELSTDAVDYINRYIAMYPDKYEIIGQPFQIDLPKYEIMSKEQPELFDAQHQAYLDRNAPKIVKMFFDLETTGVEVKKHGIHQISGCFEVNGEVVETFDIRVAPNPKAVIEPEAMSICGVTEEQIRAYPEMGGVYREFCIMLGKYVERYAKDDKIWLVGYNNRSFDDNFLRAWFVQNKDTFFGAWFWTDSLDVLVLASQYLIDRRKAMPNFKLMTVARELGIDVDESRLHDALYDIELTRAVYRIVTGIDYEL